MVKSPPLRPKAAHHSSRTCQNSCNTLFGGVLIWSGMVFNICMQRNQCFYKSKKDSKAAQDGSQTLEDCLKTRQDAPMRPKTPHHSSKTLEDASNTLLGGVLKLYHTQTSLCIHVLSEIIVFTRPRTPQIIVFTTPTTAPTWFKTPPGRLAARRCVSRQF